METKDLLRLTPGLTPRMVQWWCERGLIFCTVQRTGHAVAQPRHFSRTEALTTFLIVELQRKGLKMKKIRLILAQFRKILQRRFAGWKFPESEELFLLAASDGRYVNVISMTFVAMTILLRADAPMVVVDLRALIRKVDENEKSR